MVAPFHFSRLPLLLFGREKIALLPDLINRYGDSVLLVTGSGSFIGSKHGEKFFSSLGNRAIKLYSVTVPAEPSPDLVDSAVSKFRGEKIDVVVAIGGGSVMDAGKAVSAMLTVRGGVKEYLEGIGTAEHPGTKIPFIAVPTTSGTGSEATKNAVISEVGKSGFKRSLRHDNFIPDIALVDPGLTVSCPPWLTAASGMDCFTQLIEAYLSDKSSEYTEALAVRGIIAAASSLETVFSDGGNIDARSSMAFASLTSGICLANAGLGVVHGFASSIGGRYDIPHGVICGTLMAVSNEITVRKLVHGEGNSLFLHKYARLGEMIFGENGKSEDYYISWFVDHLHHLTYELKLPGLKEAGMSEESFDEICSSTENKNNPVKLSKDEMIEILTRRFN
jgi:alcohol dehydrogenase class IV